MSKHTVSRSPSSLKVVLIALITIISACSHTTGTETSDSSAAATTNKTAQPEVFDTHKPTSYAEYKRWRKANAPSSEAYAEYKEWEINYRRWKAQQEN